MRVTLMGTGWGSIIRPDQKGASIFVELGNGDSFVFDTGPGCGINYNVMQVPASRRGERVESGFRELSATTAPSGRRNLFLTRSSRAGGPIATTHIRPWST